MRSGRHYRDYAETDDVGCQVRGPLRQAGLRLSARGRHLSLPGRWTVEILLHQCRERAEAASLLDQRVPDLRAEKPLHDCSATPD